MNWTQAYDANANANVMANTFVSLAIVIATFFFIFIAIAIAISIALSQTRIQIYIERERKKQQQPMNMWIMDRRQSTNEHVNEQTNYDYWDWFVCAVKRVQSKWFRFCCSFCHMRSNQHNKYKLLPILQRQGHTSRSFI